MKLSEFQGCIEEYYKNMTEGKMIICPNEPDDNLTEGAEFPEFDINGMDSNI